MFYGIHTMKSGVGEAGLDQQKKLQLLSLQVTASKAIC